MPDRLPGLTGSLTQYGDDEFSLYIRTAFMRGPGWTARDWERPVIGVGHTISDFTPCHREMPDLLEAVKTRRPTRPEGSRWPSRWRRSARS